MTAGILGTTPVLDCEYGTCKTCDGPIVGFPAAGRRRSWAHCFARHSGHVAVPKIESSTQKGAPCMQS